MASLLAPSEKDALSLALSTTRTNEKITSTDRLPIRRWSSKPSKHRLVGFLPTVVVLIITLGFVGLILGFLLSMQYVPAQGGKGFSAAVKHGSFVIDEEEWSDDKSSGGHLRVLVLSALASHLISDTSSILMTLVAYRVGAQWLSVSQEGEGAGIAQNPTPLQFGLLVRLMGSSSISAISASCAYAAKSRSRPQLPRLFKQALAMSISVWVLARLVGVADLWLHTTSKSISILRPTPAPSQDYMFAAQFNETICPAVHETLQQDGAIAAGPFPCFSEFQDYVMTNDAMSNAGFSVMANETNTAWKVISLADAGDLAVLVPGSKVDTLYTSYMASTFAVQASCTSLNSLCSQDGTGMTTNCSEAGYPRLPYSDDTNPGDAISNTTQIKDFVFGIVDGELAGTSLGSLDITSPVTSNPAKMAVQLRWDTRVQGATDTVHGSIDDLAIDTYPKPTLYAGCTVSFFNATVRLDGAQNAWSLVNSTLSSPEFATTMWLPTLWQYATEQLAADLMVTSRTRSKDVVMASLNQHLARLTLGAAAGYVEPARAADVTYLVPTLLGQYPVWPVLAVLTLLCLYALLAVVVFVSSWWTTDETILPPSDDSGMPFAQEESMLVLTRTWLTNPLGLVGAAFPGEDGRDDVRSVAKKPRDMVYDGNDSHMRLAIGLTDEGFGIRKRATGQKILALEGP
ncbi:hypothetical protein FRB90_008434 [Tulasnella sp. 427]|nr:hypothetical protein FRB90_008434 [Tulasnella sp. 427]